MAWALIHRNTNTIVFQDDSRAYVQLYAIEKGYTTSVKRRRTSLDKRYCIRAIDVGDGKGVNDGFSTISE